MAVRINYHSPPNYPEGKEKEILKCLDSLLMQAPNFEHFILYRLINAVVEDIEKRNQILNLMNDIEDVLLKLEYVQRPLNLGKNTSWLELTDKGREAKKRGGHFKYQEYLEKQGNLENRIKRLQIKKYFWYIGFGIAGLISGFLIRWIFC